MKEIIRLSNVPQKIIGKVNMILHYQQTRGFKWKKLSGLSKYFSYKVNDNYRILSSKNGAMFVGDHNSYMIKIKNLKKSGGKNGSHI